MTAPHRLVNRIRTPDGTVLTSRHQHDYVSHTDAVTGEYYMLDGGVDLGSRRSVNQVPAEDISVWSNDPHELVRQVVTWGTRGPRGDQSKEYMRICDLTTDHIQAILKTQTHIGDSLRTVFENELVYRDPLVVFAREDSNATTRVA